MDFQLKYGFSAFGEDPAFGCGIQGEQKLCVADGQSVGQGRIRGADGPVERQATTCCIGIADIERRLAAQQFKRMDTGFMVNSFRGGFFFIVASRAANGKCILQGKIPRNLDCAGWGYNGRKISANLCGSAYYFFLFLCVREVLPRSPPVRAAGFCGFPCFAGLRRLSLRARSPAAGRV